MRRPVLLWVLGLTLAACTGVDPEARPSPTPPATTTPREPTPRAPDLARVRIRLEKVAEFEQPLAFAPHPDGRTIYIAEKTGRVKTLEGARTVLDLSGEVSDGYEQGLLGIAVAPDGEHLYVNFTDRRGDTRVQEFALRGERADPASRRELLFVDQPFANHNGGHLAFGPDRMLSISLGDGGAGGDPEGNAQSLDALLGKILRIDPRPDGENPYAIPPDNPFVGRPGARAEIWAYGLRNPWRFSFDRETGDLWIGDVGQNAWEEIDLEPAGSRGGRNYGWDRLEGRHRFEGEAPPGAIPPIHEYPLRGGNCAVTGGYVYRGSRIPALRGAYLFADFCVGRLFALAQRGGKVVARRALGPRLGNLASFGEDLDGELYALSLEGGVYRIAPR